MVKQMKKLKLPKNAAAIAKAAPLAVSGAVGGPFWKEVAERLAVQKPGTASLIQARPLKPGR